jgi:hypothetical protein
LAEQPVDENSLQVFLAGALHDHVQVLTHKESHPSTPGKAYVSAILCRARDGKNVLLIAEIQGHHFRELWSSLTMVKPLGVVSPSNLDYTVSNEGEFLTFWGCNPHDCGGLSGTYTYEVFDVSHANMRVFDVRRCTSGGASSDASKARVCVTNLVDDNSPIPLATQTVISKLIRSNMSEDGDILVEF